MKYYHSKYLMFQFETKTRFWLDYEICRSHPFQKKLLGKKFAQASTGLNLN